MNEEEKLFEEFDDLFYTDGYKIASDSLKSGISQDTILSMQGKIYDHIEDFLSMFQDQCWENDQTIDCRKGCSWCCRQSVMVLPQEAFYLSNFVHSHVSEELQSETTKRSESKNQITSVQTANDFLHGKTPCPFLIDNVCSVYKARPMGCRLFLSSSEQSCLNELNNPRDKSVYPLLYEFPLRAGRLLNAGACAYLEEHGLIPYEWTFESSYLVASQDNNFKVWLSGDNPFKPREVAEKELAYINKFEVSKGK